MTRVFIEASGGMTSGYIIQNLKRAGATVIASDISKDNHSLALSDEFILMPSSSTDGIRLILENAIKKHNVDLVIPSLDETLLDWAHIADSTNLNISISPIETISTFCDKWKAFKFFKDNEINTPDTSINPKYPFFKPRRGRGGSGIFTNENIQKLPEDYICQEYIKGQEYTVDCLFDDNGVLIYCIPRKRIKVASGKSVIGMTINHSGIIKEIVKFSKLIVFKGMINFQCIENERGVFFIEVNPRLAGGMALGIAATENWFNLVIENIVNKKSIKPKVEPIFPLTMYRYFHEVFA